MRLLTIHQPYAWLICAGHKRYENRTWTTNYRGPLLIHAGMSRDSLTRGRKLCDQLGIILPSRLAFGCVIGQARLIDCTGVDKVHDDFASGPFCFHLSNPVLFERPLNCRGALGLIAPSTELLAMISAMMTPEPREVAEPFA